MLKHQINSLNDFICLRMATDYMQQNMPSEEAFLAARNMVNEAYYVLVGLGAGMSTAAGAVYGGDWFAENFAEFQARYGKGPYMSDMYFAGFFPYPTQAAYWGYWSKQAMLGGVLADHTALYKTLLNGVSGKKVFCISTNTDGQIEKAGLSKDKIFCTQGDYFHIQCAKPCHQKAYDARELFKKMDAERINCEIPKELVPRCPVCGGPMVMNLRCDETFVEDDAWHSAETCFCNFVNKALESKKRILLFELGVGFNTPVIIRLPFEQLASQNDNISLLRLNLCEAFVPASLGSRAIGIDADIAKSLSKIF